ncbi:sulfate transporter family-domain-containing protein [Xylaria bambusicola]|uniref:sulfate transporter family-domain-containing protein n=1 Tax=Xylaria bambusicola TaxID=326684 RepID=UPI002007D2D9|nr:sulfate transporter family-domain-containing protein [Xylaria bambusicola]KAI0508833.1 sulfate transporter family-domain-containing protein [Xylaria bambusicola]
MPAPPPPAGGSQPPSRPRRRTTQPPSSPSSPSLPHHHTPSTPSGLRQSRTASSDSDPETSPTDHVEQGGDDYTNNESKPASPCLQQIPESSIPRSDDQPGGLSLPQTQDSTAATTTTTTTTGLGLSHSPPSLPHPDPIAPNPAPEIKTSSVLYDESTSLLHSERAHDGPCNHGTFSPRAVSPPLQHLHAESERNSLLGSEASDAVSENQSSTPRKLWKRAFSRVIKNKKMATSSALAQRHGIEYSWSMFLSYYIPCLTWMRQYQWSWLIGDLTAAITMASMYLPMALSYAENLAHVAPIGGLYAFVFQPFLYALLGSCPQMVVGPEAAGSLLIGSIVKANIDGGKGEDDNAILHSKIAGVAVGLAGASVFIMGLGRFGFVDNVLSRPFLRGFISSIGVVIFIDQLTPVLGLNKLAASLPNIPHHTTVDKFIFIVTHLGQGHRLSGIIGIVSFVIIMVLREIKRRLQPRYPTVAYFPDRLVVVVLSAFLAYFLDWEGKGVEILGKVEAPSGHVFTFRNPFQLSHLPHIREAMGTSFLIGMLGFFESSVAAKSLGDTDTIDGMQLSPNRELIALGTANIVGACFMALPAFGGYGRSKVNKSTGGKTPMSSIFVSIITVVCILYLLSWFYYLPKPVLSALIMVVAYSLIEEIPEDLFFFVKIRGWKELSLMSVIVLVTVLFSLNLGIAIGIGLSLLEVVRHATRPRIQILGRVPNSDRFANAEEHPEQVEFIEGCLIVKIPEPLTFANTGDLKSRLRRIERYGTNMAHPALPRLRPQHSNRNIIFDIHGVTSMDGSGTQVLEEIVRKYRQQGVRVFFSRAPSRNHKVWKLLEWSGIVALVGGEHLFVDDIQDALRMAESAHIDAPGREADCGATLVA